MNRIRKKIITDEAQNRVAVEIPYSDWLQIEHALNLPEEDTITNDLSSHHGVIVLTEEPLAFQARVRSEWS